MDLDLTLDRRLPDSIEVAVYYVVAEALTNAAKHAAASRANVGVDTNDAALRLSDLGRRHRRRRFPQGVWAHRATGPR